MLHLQANQAVINQNRAAGIHVFHQPRIRDGYFFIISHDLFYGERKSVSGVEHNLLSIPESTGPDLRSFCIKQYGSICMLFFPELLYQIHSVFMLGMISM